MEDFVCENSQAPRPAIFFSNLLPLCRSLRPTSRSCSTISVCMTICVCLLDLYIYSACVLSQLYSCNLYASRKLVVRLDTMNFALGRQKASVNGIYRHLDAFLIEVDLQKY